MASAKLHRRKANNEDKFLSPDRTRTIKPADFRNHKQLKDLSQDDLIELLLLMEAELQAKDVLLKAVLNSNTGTAVPLSHLLNDVDLACVDESNENAYPLNGEDEDDVWLGEASAHLNHVVAYHQVVREQMQSTVEDLQKVHKEVVEKLDEEYHKHAADTAQGDDVTYMLEKERERLQLQIEQEQQKYVELEKDRDTLRDVLEKERKEYYNSFNELLNDCKTLAQQLVHQSSKHDKHQKEVDKEKSKNKVLSELMVEETQKFKEKLRQYEEEVRDFHVLEQKKNDLENRLVNSDKQMKDTFHLLNEERKKNNILMYELNQLRKQFPGDCNHDDNNEDILLVQDQYEIPVREARNSTIQLSQPDRDSPEPNTVLPLAVPVQTPKVATATVTKSSSVRQTKNYNSPQVKSGVVVSLNNHANSPRVNSYAVAPDAQQIKRHSYEERSYNKQPKDEAASKRNSYEGVLNQSGPMNHDLSRSPTVRQKPSSYEDMRDVGGAAAASVTPKRNSYEGDSKKVPPPAPPRRGSTLTPQDKPPIVKIPQQFQPRKSNHSTPSASDAYKQQSRSSNTDDIFLMLCVVYNHGWEYECDSGFCENGAVKDFLSLLSIKPTNTWSDVTSLVNKTFERECPTQIHENQENITSCIACYEYGSNIWTIDRFPSISFNKALSQNLYPITIKLKGFNENSLDDLSYSSLVPVSTLEECIRILEHENRLMFTINEEIEGRYIVSCLAKWLKLQEEDRQGNLPCQIISIEQSDCQDVMNLTNTLLNLGIIYKHDEKRLSHKYIVILNIDTLENQGMTSVIFDWLSHDIEKKKSTQYYTEGLNDENYSFHKDVTVISYATNNKVTCLSQQAYRLFKIVSLPTIHQTLITRWLRQKIIHYTPGQVYDLCMVNTVKWLSDLYENLHKSFFKIQLIHKLPDVTVYLEAPLDDKEQLYEWVKSLWNESLTPCVEESVRQRTSAATEAQRVLLIKATLKALFEKSIRNGCPVDIKF